MTLHAIVGVLASFMAGLIIAAGGQLLIVIVDISDCLLEIKLNTDELSEFVEDAVKAGRAGRVG